MVLACRRSDFENQFRESMSILSRLNSDTLVAMQVYRTTLRCTHRYMMSVGVLKRTPLQCGWYEDAARSMSNLARSSSIRKAPPTVSRRRAALMRWHRRCPPVPYLGESATRRRWLVFFLFDGVGAGMYSIQTVHDTVRRCHAPTLIPSWLLVIHPSHRLRIVVIIVGSGEFRRWDAELPG